MLFAQALGQFSVGKAGEYMWSGSEGANGKISRYSEK